MEKVAKEAEWCLLESNTSTMKEEREYKGPISNMSMGITENVLQ